VADELVREMKEVGSSEEVRRSPSRHARTYAHPQACAQYDQKNIRRRVYDALNVLMAMDIIRKDKKEILWVGLPTSSLQELADLEVHWRTPALDRAT
jgi:hypothetical protein